MAFPLADFPPLAFVVAPLVVTFAYVVYGITGFGATVVILPIMAQVVPLKFMVPLSVVMDLSAFILLSAKSGRQIDRKEVLWLLPFMLVGMAAGALLLANAPERWLLLGLGIYITTYAAINLMAFKVHTTTISRNWGIVTGMAGGVTSALFGIGGPLYVIYVSRRTTDLSVMRATMSALILISGLTRFVMFIANKLLLSWAIFTAWILLLPFVWGGATLGMKLHDRMSIANVRRVIYVILLVSGGSLIVRALAASG